MLCPFSFWPFVLGVTPAATAYYCYFASIVKIIMEEASLAPSPLHHQPVAGSPPSSRAENTPTALDASCSSSVLRLKRTIRLIREARTSIKTPPECRKNLKRRRPNYENRLRLTGRFFRRVPEVVLHHGQYQCQKTGESVKVFRDKSAPPVKLPAWARACVTASTTTGKIKIKIGGRGRCG